MPSLLVNLKVEFFDSQTPRDGVSHEADHASFGNGLTREAAATRALSDLQYTPLPINLWSKVEWAVKAKLREGPGDPQGTADYTCIISFNLEGV
jgi:hypothetical protein